MSGGGGEGGGREGEQCDKVLQGVTSRDVVAGGRSKGSTKVPVLRKQMHTIYKLLNLLKIRLGLGSA